MYIYTFHVNEIEISNPLDLIYIHIVTHAYNVTLQVHPLHTLFDINTYNIHPPSLCVKDSHPESKVDERDYLISLTITVYFYYQIQLQKCDF